MMIIGTIRESVGLAMASNEWQQKKANINKYKIEMTPEEKQIEWFKEQLEDIRENKKPAYIDAKLESGAKLTLEEIEYLRKHNPQALKEYEEIQRERESYKKELRKCKTKEEVEELKINKMGECLASLKSVVNNANIPDSAKCSYAKKILKIVAAVQDEHQKFVESLQYSKLPETEEEKKDEKKNKVEDTEDAEIQPDSDEIIPDVSKLNEQIREMIAELEPKNTVKNETAIDMSIPQNTVTIDGAVGMMEGGIDIKA